MAKEVRARVALHSNVSSVNIPRGTSNLRLSWLYVASDAGEFQQRYYCYFGHFWKLPIPHGLPFHLRCLDIILGCVECIYSLLLSGAGQFETKYGSV